MGNKKVLLCVLLCAIGHGCGGGGGSTSPGQTCAGAGRAGDCPSDVAQGANEPPAISGTPVTRVHEEDSYTFAPTATDADGDALSFAIDNGPAWLEFDASSGRLAGTPRSADVGLHPNIRISVSDGVEQAALPPFDITVAPVFHGGFTLSWQPPTQNTNDTALEDLDGFNIYWGTSAGDYTNQITVDNEGTTSRFIDGLDAGTYYFATTAFNSFGIESELSDPAIIVIR